MESTAARMDLLKRFRSFIRICFPLKCQSCDDLNVQKTSDKKKQSGGFAITTYLRGLGFYYGTYLKDTKRRKTRSGSLFPPWLFIFRAMVAIFPSSLAFIALSASTSK